VTWEGALNIDVANNSGAILVTVAGGLTLTGANGKGAGSLSIEGSANFDSALDVTGTETLNNATLTFGGFNGALEGGGSSASSALTLGSNFVIKQSGADNNLDGTIVNDGVINVTAGKLTDVGAFTNNGAITVGNGAAFVFDGTTTFGALGQLTTSGSGDFAVSYAAVLSGILNASNANFEFVAGTLSGVTWEGPLTISAPAGSDEGLTVNVMGGLTLTRAGGLGLGSGSLNIDGSLTTVIINVEDSETSLQRNADVWREQRIFDKRLFRRIGDAGYPDARPKFYRHSEQRVELSAKPVLLLQRPDLCRWDRQRRKHRSLRRRSHR
jgi:hypothetical protein